MSVRPILDASRRVVRLVPVLFPVLLATGCPNPANDIAPKDSAEEPIVPESLLECFTDVTCPYLTSIAHRGASRFAPENTLAAFEKAAELEADGVEMDVRTTADGALVLMHDGSVDRTTDGSGDVSKMTLDEIQSLRALSEFEGVEDQAVPTFFEALVLVRDLGLAVDVDVKDATGEDLAREIEAAGMIPYVFLNTGSVPEGESFRAANPAMAIMPSITDPSEIEGYLALDPELIEVDYLDLPDIAAPVHAAGSRLFTQTLGFEYFWAKAGNYEEQWGAVFDAGVVVLQTDYPELLAPMLQSWNEELARAGATW